MQKNDVYQQHLTICEKKHLHLARLKLVVRARLVVSGVLIDNLEWRFKNPLIQSGPAIESLNHDWGNLILYFTAHSNASFRASYGDKPN